jgi:hypothetical protein
MRQLTRLAALLLTVFAAEAHAHRVIVLTAIC